MGVLSEIIIDSSLLRQNIGDGILVSFTRILRKKWNGMIITIHKYPINFKNQSTLRTSVTIKPDLLR
jgi:hypothetical protein